jgi:thiazole/oxazole-forming peptide maturase SagD family component
MQVSIGGDNSSLSPRTALLLRRMLCPMTGLSQSIGLVLRSALEPRLAIAGGEMTGVHLLRGLPAPRAGAYHIGGSGTTYEEAIIGTLGETVERYAHYASIAGGCHRITVASLDEINAGPHPVSIVPDFQHFSDDQFARSGFPYSRIDASAPIGWVAATSMVEGAMRWAPAQETLVGYVRQPEERRYMVGVTTGTAAHTDPDKALRNALLELIQIDSAMGHWYGNRPALLLEPDGRTRAVFELIERHRHPAGPDTRFYWLSNPDLPGFAVACVIAGGEIPRAAVGLGCDLRLERAIYKAFLEGVAVAQLAKVILFRQSVDEYPARELGGDSPEIYDLDTNVAFYASQDRSRLGERFAGGPVVGTSDLPPDAACDPACDCRYLIEAFAKTGKELVYLDLTTCDVAELGFRVTRVWSPDTLSLCLPSAPPAAHHRFRAYGGVIHEDPHPYP